MKGMEGFSGAPKVPQHDYDVEDYVDNETLYLLLRKLPKELQVEQMRRIDGLEDEEAIEHLQSFHERRTEALRESVVSDETLKPYFEANKEKIWEALETTVFTDEENYLGAGTTARIKRFDLSSIAEDAAPVPELAVKYLVTPNERTLSASGEHDMLLEVEKFQAIERAELLANGEDIRVRVPHPYFSYQKGKTQCYGMQLIDGVNLEQGRMGRYTPDQKEAFRTAFKDVDTESILKDVDRFFDTMHSICLHGDVKPRNLMVSREGFFYVIDLGQSLLPTQVDDRGQDAFEELKTAEKKNAKEAVRIFLFELFKED